MVFTNLNREEESFTYIQFVLLNFYLWASEWS